MQDTLSLYLLFKDNNDTNFSLILSHLVDLTSIALKFLSPLLQFVEM